jgi:coenzyme F420-reducing hydrogenase beta subunit
MRIDTKDKKRCCGCGACVVACPCDCIGLAADDEGCNYPQIDDLKCTNCGKCLVACGMQSELELNRVQGTFAAWNTDQEIRKRGTSGGLFMAFAESIFQWNGKVSGAVFSDDFQCVEHIIANDLHVASKMQGSKYVQSQTTNAFKEIISYLKNVKKVFFTGTPCQVASLKKLTNNDPNLLTCDILCHGVPSEKVFQSYLSDVTNGAKVPVSRYSFRDKSRGWNFPLLNIQFADGRNIFKVRWTDNFLSGYYRNIFLRPCCYQCPFARVERAGDITLGDCWRVAASHPQYDDNKGTSLLLVNTAKGEELVADAFDHKRLFKGKYDLRLASERNMPLRAPVKEPVERELFFKVLIGQHSFSVASRSYVSVFFKFRKYMEYTIKRLLWPILRRIQ